MSFGMIPVLATCISTSDSLALWFSSWLVVIPMTDGALVFDVERDLTRRGRCLSSWPMRPSRISTGFLPAARVLLHHPTLGGMVTEFHACESGGPSLSHASRSDGGLVV